MAKPTFLVCCPVIDRLFINHMKTNHLTQLTLGCVWLIISLGFSPVYAPDVTGSWRMTAHRVSPAQDGITDLYSHFKDLYGGCQKDMGVTLNTDKTMTVTPAGGCQNPLGNLIMKAAAKFMPSGNVTWEITDNKITLKDKKGQVREYTLQQSGMGMEWVFDETGKQGTVRHTIVFERN